MDILFWTQLNPEIRLEHTTKRYFQKYLYRLVLYAPGYRRELLKNSSGYQRIGYVRLSEIDVEFLETLKSIRENFPEVKFRIDDPDIQIYASNSYVLELIASRLRTHEQKYIKAITYPENQNLVDILNSGAILVKKKNNYTHKVMIKDGRYSIDIKKQVLSYLTELGDIVKLSNGSRKMLEKPYTSTWGVFFYTNDVDITTFLELVRPGIISNIYELVSNE
jgi:hypothetical protein